MNQRELKFRIWDAQSRTMMPWRGLKDHYSALIVGVLDKPDENWMPMQFTGLKDKRGKEIYHKDFIKTEIGVYLVEWDNQAAAFRYLDNIGNSESPLNYDYVEVIGNIYENPELLN